MLENNTQSVVDDDSEFDDDVDLQPKTVPYSKFAKARVAKREMAKQFESMKTQAEAAMAAAKQHEASVADWAKRYQELETTHNKTVMDFEVNGVFRSEGIDDADAIDFIKYKYQQLPVSADKTKPKFSMWFNEYKESKPSILSKYQKAEPQDEVASSVKKPVNVNKGIVPGQKSQVANDGRMPDMRGWSTEDIREYYKKSHGIDFSKK